MYSTGQKTKTAVVAYRMGLYREGKLIPEKSGAFFRRWRKSG
jgi:hypothetical protein